MTRLAPKTPSGRNRHTIPARWSAAKINIHPTIDSTTHHASATRHGSLLSDRKPQRRSRRPGSARGSSSAKRTSPTSPMAFRRGRFARFNDTGATLIKRPAMREDSVWPRFLVIRFLRPRSRKLDRATPSQTGFATPVPSSPLHMDEDSCSPPSKAYKIKPAQAANAASQNDHSDNLNEFDNRKKCTQPFDIIEGN